MTDPYAHLTDEEMEARYLRALETERIAKRQHGRYIRRAIILGLLVAAFILKALGWLP